MNSRNLLQLMGLPPAYADISESADDRAAVCWLRKRRRIATWMADRDMYGGSQRGRRIARLSGDRATAGRLTIKCIVYAAIMRTKLMVEGVGA